MPKINIEMEIDEKKAFWLLLDALDVKLDEDIKENAFDVEDGEIVVKDYDDRGELYLALYHLATKIFPNTEFRSMFDDPRKLMTKLYEERDKEDQIDKDITNEKENKEIDLYFCERCTHFCGPYKECTAGILCNKDCKEYSDCEYWSN